MPSGRSRTAEGLSSQDRATRFTPVRHRLHIVDGFCGFCRHRAIWVNSSMNPGSWVGQVHTRFTRLHDFSCSSSQTLPPGPWPWPRGQGLKSSTILANQPLAQRPGAQILYHSREPAPGPEARGSNPLPFSRTSPGSENHDPGAMGGQVRKTLPHAGLGWAGLGWAGLRGGICEGVQSYVNRTLTIHPGPVLLTYD